MHRHCGAFFHFSLDKGGFVCYNGFCINFKKACMTMKKHLYAACVIFAGIFWATSCLFIDVFASLGFSSTDCTAIRMIFGAILLHITLLIKGRGFRYYRIDRHTLLLTALTGVCAVLGASYFYYLSIAMTSAAVGAILLNTAPFFVMIMSLFLFSERLSAKKIAAFLIALVGCSLVSGVAGGVKLDALGILFGVLSGLSYSLYSIFTSLYIKRGGHDSFTFITFSFTFAAIASLFICSPVGIMENVMCSESPLVTFLLFFAFGLATSVCPYLLYTTGLSGIRASVASILAFSEPLAAAVFGLIFLHQGLDIYGIIGIVMVTAAIILINLHPHKTEKEEG